MTVELSEQQKIFSERHEQYMKKLCKIFKTDLDELNILLKKSKIIIAGGYARRLYMMKKGIPMSEEDWDAYFSSDLDLYVLRYSTHTGSPDEKDKKVNKPSSSSLGNLLKRTFPVTIEDVQPANQFEEFHYKIQYLPFGGMKLGSKLKEVNLTVKEADDDITLLNTVNEETLTYSLTEKKSVLETIDDDYKVQLIFINGHAVNQIRLPSQYQHYDKSLQNTIKIVDSFDLDCTTYFLGDLSMDINNTTVTNLKHNYGSDFYVTRFNHNLAYRAITRLFKYSEIGFKFDMNETDWEFKARDNGILQSYGGTY